MHYEKPKILDVSKATPLIQGGSSIPKGESFVDSNPTLQSASPAYEADE